MADEQRPDSDAPEDSENAENSPQRRGFGRFASRFRRDREQPAEPAEPEADGAPPPTEVDRDDTTNDAKPRWLTPASLDQTPPGPEPLAPELDLSGIPPGREPQAVEPEEPPEERDTEPTAEQAEPAALQAEPAEAPEEEERDDERSEADVEVTPAPPPEPPPPASLPPRHAAPEPTPSPSASSAPSASPLGTDDPTASPVGIAPASEFDRLEGNGAQVDDAQAWGPRTRPAGISAHLAVLTAVATSIIMAFLLIEPSPRWLLLLGAAAVVFGLDGTLRQTWRSPFSLGQETAPFLFVPALYMMAVPVLIEHNVSGELVFLVGLGAGFGFGALAWAEIASVRAQAPEYDQARVIVTANTYLTGFAIFSLSYVFEIGLLAAIVATSIAAAMLAVEVLREGEIDPMETLGLSLVTGVIIGEARWLLYYVPLDTYLAGLTLLLAFYLATGLLHSHLIRALNRVVAAEYSGIAAAGLALVILARAVGLA